MPERALYFAADAEMLFGMWAEPSSDRAPDLTVVLLADASPNGMAGQGATMTRLARAITAAGLSSFRFDYRGIGESSGSPPYLRLDAPFLDDLSAGLRWLRDHGRTRFALVGSCFGAQTALVAATRSRDVAGLVLLSCPIATAGDDGQTSMSELMLASVRNVTSRGLPTLFCYGSEENHYVQFAAASELRDVCQASDALQVEVLPGEVHSFRDAGLQEEIILAVVEWLVTLLSNGKRLPIHSPRPRRRVMQREPRRPKMGGPTRVFAGSDTWVSEEQVSRRCRAWRARSQRWSGRQHGLR